MSAPDTKSKAFAGKGTIFSIQTSGAAVTPIVYTQVAELKNLGQSGGKNNMEDVTNFDSAGRFQEFITTTADSGDWSIAGNYIPSDAGQAAFRAAFNTGATLSFTMVLPLQPGQTDTGETWTFLGIVQELDTDVAYDKAVTFSAKLKITGPITVVLGS